MPRFLFVVFLLDIVGTRVFIESHIEKIKLVLYEKINIPMADVPEFMQQEKGEQGTDKKCWHGKFQKEMDNDDMEEEYYESSIDDEEENSSDNVAINNTGSIPQRQACMAVTVEGTEHGNAIGCGRNGREGSEEVSAAEDMGHVSIANIREQGRNRKSSEQLLALYEHEGLLEGDEDDDDTDWEPFEGVAVQMKWYCTNCTMANSDDSVHCDSCGEHRNSDILSQGFFASPYLPAERPSNSEVPDERLEGNCVMATLTPSISPMIGVSCSSVQSERRTAVGFDERMLLHSEIQMERNPHPERPDRLRAIAASLRAAGLFPGKCFPIPAREATWEELAMIHSLEHVNAVESTSCGMPSHLSPDTYANEHSSLAARLAAGLCADLAKAIMTGQAQNGFALVRPPGHHAGVKDSKGFCLHNNAAIAVSASRVAGAKKVLIVDWDVHHGNGTQEIFEADQSVLYISLHRHGEGFYPGSGAVTEVGSSKGEGYSVNIPWKCGGVGDDDYIFAFQHAVLPIAEEFAPDLTIISAGFDAAKGDPLGRCEVTPDGFAHMAQMLSCLSRGKMLVILEGGYNLRSISASATAVIKVLLGDNPKPLPIDIQPSKGGLQTLLEVFEVQSKYWSNLKGHDHKLLSQWEAQYGREKRKVIRKRHMRIVGGPVWWKWGRKRVVYYHWFARVSSRKHL